MSGSRPPLSPEASALLDQEREIPALPAPVRARALARSRAAVVAGVRLPVTSGAPPRMRWAAAVAFACVASAALGAAAYGLRARFWDPPIAHPTTTPTAAAATPARTTPAVSAAPAPTPARSVDRPLSPADTAREELRLLRQARAAVSRADYADALPPIAEHARRFRDGRLAEEREALRVKSLAGLGRTEEAHRAAAGFEARFPRSVLLPAVRRMPASEP